MNIKQPNDPILEMKMLGYLLKVLESRKYMDELVEKDFYSEEAKQTFKEIKNIFLIDPTFSYEDFVATATENAKFVLKVAKVPLNKPFISSLKALKDLSFGRSLVDECLHTASTKISDSSPHSATLDLIANLKNLMNDNLLRLLRASDMNLGDMNITNLFDFPYPSLRQLVIPKGSFGIIGARPSVGKTTFMLNIAARMPDISSAIITLEMPFAQLASKILKLTKTPFEERGNLDFIKIIDSVYKFESLISAIHTLVKIENVKVIFVDYLQLIETSKNFNSRYLEVTYMTRQLKLLAIDLGISIICLAQLNRDSADIYPRMSDLRESGSLEQDADFILLLHERLVSDGNPPIKKFEVIIAKNRFGQNGDLKELSFNKTTGSIDELQPWKH